MLFEILIAGFSLFMADFVGDIEKHLCELNKKLPHTYNVTNTIQIKKHLYDIIEFHAEAKGLSSSFFIKC